MRAMLLKDVLERFLDGPFHYEELRNRVSAYVGEKLAGQDVNGGPQPMDIGQIDKSEGEDEDVNAVQQRRPHDRSHQKHKQLSDNERKPFNRRTANLSPSAPRQSTPRDKKPWSGETNQSAGEKKRLVCCRCGKGHPARLCPSGDDCQDVDEVGTEPSSDADRDLFGLDWGDDPIATINSVTDRTRGGQELWAFVDSGAVDNVLPKSVCTEYHQEATSKSQSGVGFKGANGSHQALWAATVSSQDKRWKQCEHHLGSRGCTQAVDFRQSSARERSRACIGREAEGSSARMETQIRLRGLVVCSPYRQGRTRTASRKESL